MESMMNMMQMMQMMSGMGGKFGKGGKGGAAEGGVCSVHGRKRTAQNLMDDGNGGVCCIPAQECRTSASDDSMRDGDWLCPSCSDHQFAKNISCRKCGEPRP